MPSKFPCVYLATISLLFFGYRVRCQKPAALYQQYCAACHGRQMEGALGSKLIKADWKYGRQRGDLVRNIKFGIPGTDMRAWNKVLDQSQIDALADYIFASQKTPPDAPRSIPSTIKTKNYTIRVTRVVKQGLKTPWSIEFIDKNKALISERAGRLRWMINGELDPVPIHGTPRTLEVNTGGYFDIALDPHYKTNGWIYLAYSHFAGDSVTGNSPGMTRIARGRIRGHDWTEEQVIFTVPDSLYVVEGSRWGGRLIFDKMNRLYFSIGDMNKGPNSQKLWRPEGKIFRINADGSIPNDNPFIDSAGALKAIYTIGNRNAQGFDFNPQTGELWASEHGPMGGDELNVIKSGKNYGWPLVTYGIDYSGDTVSRLTHSKGMEQPLTEWNPSIAPCPISFVRDGKFARWKNSLLVGALSFEELRLLKLNGRRVMSQEVIIKNYGRVRDLKNGPDGSIYVVFNNPDIIVKLDPEVR